MDNPSVSDLPGTESRKRLDILDGARRVFRASGYEGASMGEIARAAGVSKGTLYVYFEHKEALFRALIQADKGDVAEQLLQLPADDPDVAGVLTRLGISFVHMMVRPDHIALLRMVIGAADRFPEIGRFLYEIGPAFGTQQLAIYLAAQSAAGRLSIDDPELAGHQFFNLCQGRLVKPLLFGIVHQPSDAAIDETVATAVAAFLRIYAPGR